MTGSNLKPKSKYTIVPMPRIVYFYPTMIAAIVIFVLQSYFMHKESSLLCFIFLCIFTFNLCCLSFNFPGAKAVLLMIVAMVAIFTITHFSIKNTIFYKHLFLTSTSYIYIAIVYFLMISIGVIVNYLWGSWTIEPNRFYHKDGISGNIKEWPVANLQVEEKIDNVLEYSLLLSGTLVLCPSDSTSLYLKNVVFIKSVKRKIISFNGVNGGKEK